MSAQALFQGRRRRGRSLLDRRPEAPRRVRPPPHPRRWPVVVAKLSREQVTAWLEASCAEQGVPVKVTDPQTLAKVAALLRPAGGAPRSRAQRG